MISDKLDDLQDYPFWRMNALVRDIPLPDGHERAIPMWIGEPRHGVPEIARAPLRGSFEGYGIYPPIEGTPSLRRVMTGWLNRRYGLPDTLIDPDRAMLPVQGTREGLFMIALAAVPRTLAGRTPAALLPNPFYQPYKGGAVAAGAEPVFLPCAATTDFLPDLGGLTSLGEEARQSRGSVPAPGAAARPWTRPAPPALRRLPGP